MPSGTPIFTNISTSNPANTNGDPNYPVSEWTGEHGFNGLLSLEATDVLPDGSRFIVCEMKTSLIILKLEANGQLRYWKRFTGLNFPDFTSKAGEMELSYNSIANTFTLAYSKGYYGNEIHITKLSGNMLTILSSDVVNLPTGVLSGRYESTGIEFSPDKSKLYVSSGVQFGVLAQSHLNAIDLTVSPPVLNLLYLPNSFLARYSFIEKALDGKMYLANPNGLYEIQNPNNLALVSISNTPTVTTPIEITRSGHSLDFFCQRNYQLPDQVDGMDYLAHFTATQACCIENTTYNKITYTNIANGIWSATTVNPISGTITNTVTIREELRIKRGTSIAIQNMTIKFAPGARLVIEEGNATTNGGLLELINTKLTVDEQCSTTQLWEGVEVRGINTQTQGTNPSFMNSKQGRLNLFSNSTIEHAKIGATNYKRDPLSPGTGFIVLGSQGGVIYGQFSNFLNNKIDVEFDRYSSPTGVNDFSSFTDCNFKTTQLLKDGSNPIGHIRMTRTRGVQIVGCEFENTISSPYVGINRGVGVWARQASVIVTAGCVTFSGPTCVNWNNPNVFKNLHTGIHTFSSIATQSLKSDRNQFVNNNTGIYMASTNNAQVSRNKFTVEEIAGIKSYGVYMIDGNSHFLMDENLFSVDLPALSAAETFGIWTKGSGSENNMIYKNSIEFVKYGCYASSNNANPSPTPTSGSYGQGLQYRCNNFRTGQHDLILENGSLRQTQGSFPIGGITSTSANQNAANNTLTFGPDPIAGLHDFKITGLQNPIPLRYYHVSGATQIPNSFVVGTLQPVPITLGAIPIIFNTNIGCPSRIDPPILGLAAAITQKEVEITALKSNLTNGASQTLIDNINSGSINTKLASVLAVSPYASDDVLVAFLNRNPSNGHILQVVLANSPVTQVVKDKLNTMGLPNGIKNQINSAQNGNPTPIEAAYLQLNENQFLLENAVDAQIRNIVFDETYTKTLSDLKNIVASRPEKFYQQYTVNVDITRGDNVAAQDRINSLGTYGRSQEINEIEIGINSLNSTKLYLDQNVSALIALNSIKNDSINYCVCSGRAEAILYEFENCLGAQFGYDITLINSSMMSNNSINENNASIDKSFILKSQTIYPNPAETEITITNLQVDEGTLLVIDLTGKVLINQAIDETNKVTIESLKSGAYILQIRDKNNLFIQTERFFKK